MSIRKTSFCPYCGAKHDRLAPAVGAFLEMGEYDGKSYASEGDAEGYRCIDCGGEFWTNGPAMPDVVEDETA